jgi:hypothetical protein
MHLSNLRQVLGFNLSLGMKRSSYRYVCMYVMLELLFDKIYTGEKW